MPSPSFRSAVLAVALSLALPSAIAAVSVGHVDDFEDGTTQGWTINQLGMGVPPPNAYPTNIASGGPSGADDNYLLLTAVGGSGGGSRLTAINASAAWTGNFTSAGISGIRLQARNFGTADVQLRLLLENPVGGVPTDVAFSADPLVLPAGGDWTTLEFSLAVADLITLQGDVNALLGNVTALRLFHSSQDAFPGEPIAAQLGVDNVTALANGEPPPGVPEPASWLLAVTALFGAWASRRRKQ